MSKRYDLRIVVGTPDGSRSGMWHVFAKRGQVYVSYGTMGGVKKLSFHSQEVCRDAFTSEFGTPATLHNRATHEWLRSATPSAGGGRGACVLQVGFPTDSLSTALAPVKKACQFVPAAPAGMITVLEFFFTHEVESEIRRVAPDGNRIVVGYASLETGEGFAITARHAEWENRDLLVPASHHEDSDMFFLSSDPDHTGRPIRL